MVRLKEETRHLADVLKSLIIVVSVALALQSYPPARRDIVQAEPKPNPFYVATEPIQALEQPNLPKVEPVATIKPKPAPASSTAVSGGNCEDWMRQAGIPVNATTKKLIINESGCKPHAKNPSSGACGIPQAWPCSKLPCELNNSGAVCQLKWMDSYVKGRYGSWDKALSFWYAQCGTSKGCWY